MPRPKRPQPSLCTAEAAKHVNLSRSTLEKMRCYPSMGGPPFIKMGARCAYRLADLDEWLAARLRKPGSDRRKGPGRRRPDVKDPRRRK